MTFGVQASAQEAAQGEFQTVEQARQQMRGGRPLSAAPAADVPDWAKTRIRELEASAASRKEVGTVLLVISALSAGAAVAGAIHMRGDCIDGPGCTLPLDAFALIVGGATALVTLPTGALVRQGGVEREEEAQRLRLSFSPTRGSAGLSGGVAGVRFDF
jgi:hypothetical protein